MQATNVSQPIKYTVGLPSCRFTYDSRYKSSISKGVKTLPILNELVRKINFLDTLWNNAEEVSLFLLSILEPGSLVLDRIRINLNIFPLSLAISNLICLRKYLRLFGNSLFSELLQFKAFLIVQNIEIDQLT